MPTAKACEEPLMALFECLQESDCMKKENRPLRDCLAEVDEVRLWIIFMCIKCGMS